jgi:methionine-rich copper-binding protein CopC
MKSKLALLFAVFFLIGAPSAQANQIVTSSPAASSVLTVAPNIVSLQAQSALTQQGSTLSVLDPNGNEVDDRSQTVSGNTIAVGMQNLTLSGSYTVNYALFSDTDQPLIGSYQFTFNAPASVTSGDTSTATNQNPSSNPNSNSNSTSNSGTASNNTNSGSSGNTFIYVLMFLALLVALLLLWYTYYLIRKSRNK